MLQTLLWRCPICKTQDVLTHLEHRFKHDQIDCSACQSRWELIRVFGGSDFRLRLISGNGITQERPLAEWYDQMMEGMKLEPIEHPSWPLLDISHPNERLYLYSPTIMGLASPDDPIFQHENASPPPDAPGVMGLRPLGPGQLFFTSHRLIYILTNKLTLSKPWKDLRSADTLMDRFFSLGFENRVYFFSLKGQSVLKWLAHTRLIVKQTKNDSKRRIYLGYV